MNNLREVGHALLLYIQDHEDRLHVSYEYCIEYGNSG